jgi:hypothetical protein
VALSVLAVSRIVIAAPGSTEIDAALKDAAKKYDTKEGQEYAKKVLVGGPLGKAVVNALNACGKGNIDLRSYVVVVIAADGKVERVVTEPTPFGKCVAKYFQIPDRLPKPPGKSWSVPLMIAYEATKPKAKPDN